MVRTRKRRKRGGKKVRKLQRALRSRSVAGRLACGSHGSGRWLAAEFGSRLRAWRIHKNWALRSVAEELGVSVQIVSDWERGMRFPSLPHLQKLGEILDVPLCWFFRDGSSCATCSVPAWAETSSRVRAPVHNPQ